MRKVAAGIIATLFTFVALIGFAMPAQGGMWIEPQTLELSTAKLQVQPHEHTIKDLHYAKIQTSCYVYGKAMGKPHKEIAIFVSRVGKFKGTEAVLFQIGYVTGVLDAMGMVDAGKFGGYSNARVMAANHFYKVLKCSTAQSL